MKQYSKIAGMLFAGLLAYSLIGGITYRLVDAKWTHVVDRSTCEPRDNGTMVCDDIGDGLALAGGMLWPVALPVAIGIAASGKAHVEDALARQHRVQQGPQ